MLATPYWMEGGSELDPEICYVYVITYELPAHNGS